MNKKFKALFFMVAIAVLFMLAPSKSVQAAGKITGLKQTSAATSYVEIQWDAVLGNNISYRVEYSKSKDSGYTFFRNSETPTMFMGNLSQGSTYYVRVRAYGDNGACTDYAILEVVTKPSDTVRNLKQTVASEDSITLSWDKLSRANAYQVIYKKANDSTSEKKTVITANKITLKKLSKNTRYTVYVYAIRRSNSYTAISSNYSYAYGCATIPTKVTGLVCTEVYPASHCAYFSVKENKIADGYQYYVYDNTGKKKLVSGTTSSYRYINPNSTKLKAGSFYKIKVRAYVNVNGKKNYGKWSNELYFAGDVQGTSYKLSNGKLSISWKKMKGATNYDVFVATKKPSTLKDMTKVKSATKSTSFTLKKFKKKTVSKKKNYYVSIRANKKVGKKTYSSLVTKYIYHL